MRDSIHESLEIGIIFARIDWNFAVEVFKRFKMKSAKKSRGFLLDTLWGPCYTVPVKRIVNHFSENVLDCMQLCTICHRKCRTGKEETGKFHSDD